MQLLQIIAQAALSIVEGDARLRTVAQSVVRRENYVFSGTPKDGTRFLVLSPHAIGGKEEVSC
jgi:hypothetical protein